MLIYRPSKAQHTLEHMLIQVSSIFTLAIPTFALLRQEFEQPDRILDIRLQLSRFHTLI